jgi:hypothetical protein
VPHVSTIVNRLSPLLLDETDSLLLREDIGTRKTFKKGNEGIVFATVNLCSSTFFWFFVSRHSCLSCHSVAMAILTRAWCLTLISLIFYSGIDAINKDFEDFGAPPNAKGVRRPFLTE